MSTPTPTFSFDPDPDFSKTLAPLQTLESCLLESVFGQLDDGQAILRALSVVVETN